VTRLLSIPFAFVRSEEVAASAPPVQLIAGDAGFDLTVSRDLVVEPDTFARIPTNVAVALPEGMWGLLNSRSSTFYQRGLIIIPGIIDCGYRGEIMAQAYNLGKKGVVIRKGERLFQLIPMTNLASGMRWMAVAVEKLPKSSRGEAGFGSTGGFQKENGK
jgi:dUTP pyrophosphatase